MRTLVKKGWFFPCIVSILIYLTLASMAIQKPMAGDEPHFLEQIRGYVQGTYRADILGYDLTHEYVPLYLLCLAFLEHLFGENLLIFRLIGVVSFCFVIFLLNRFLFKILPDRPSKKWALWTLPLLVATHPASIQGSVILDWETTLFLSFFVLFCLIWLTRPFKTPFSFLIPSFLYALSLWARTVSALVVAFSWIVWSVCFRPKKEESFHLLKILLAGFFLFLVSWGIYVFFAWGISHFFDPFLYFLRRLIHPSRVGGRLQDFARLLLWVGIPWVFLFLTGLFKGVPKSLFPLTDRLHFLKVVVFFGIPVYHFVAGSSWGYPKWTVGFIPLAAFLFIVLWVPSLPPFTRKEMPYLFIISGAILFVSFAFIKDPLYELCYVMKKSLMLGSTLRQELPRLVWLFGVPSFLLVATCLLIFFLFRKKTDLSSAIVLGALVTAFSTQLPFAAIQSHAPYPTVSLYGDRDKSRAVSILKEQLSPDEFILAPELIIPYEAGSKATYLGSPPWRDSDTFLKTLREKRPKAVVYSFSTLSMHSYREVVQNPKVQEALRADFIEQKIGDYSLWLRKKN